VKAGSDSKAEIRSVDLDLSTGYLQQGAVKVLQSADEAHAVVAYNLPADKRTGLTIAEIPARERPAPASVNWNGLKIEEHDQIDADQSWARDGAFENMFYINLNLTNTTDNPKNILKVSAAYQNGEQWVKPNSCAIGHKHGFYHYAWDWNNTYVGIAPHHPERLAVLVGITVKAPQCNRNRKAHYSLPDPLVIRITFEDDQGNSETITVQYLNQPQDLPTFEKKKDDDKLIYFLPVDDVETETRHYFSIDKVTEDEDTRLELKSTCNSTSHYLYKWGFQRIAFKAINEGKSEVPLDDVKFDSNGLLLNVYALVDLARRVVYALKIDFKTNTGSVEGYFPIPAL